jgi:exonuclease III
MVGPVKVVVVCLQETKLQQINESLLSDMLGAGFKHNFSFSPADGTCGGILIAVSENHFKLMASSRSKYTLTVRIQALMDALEWTLTSVYGPQLEADKIAFLEEIKSLQQGIQGEWLICGDFNLIYKAEEKNSCRLNRRIMGRFKSILDELERRELPLHERKYTWTNAQSEATMTKIDQGPI